MIPSAFSLPTPSSLSLTRPAQSSPHPHLSTAHTRPSPLQSNSSPLLRAPPCVSTPSRHSGGDLSSPLRSACARSRGAGGGGGGVGPAHQGLGAHGGLAWEGAECGNVYEFLFLDARSAVVGGFMSWGQRRARPRVQKKNVMSARVIKGACPWLPDWQSRRRFLDDGCKPYNVLLPARGPARRCPHGHPQPCSYGQESGIRTRYHTPRPLCYPAAPRRWWAGMAVNPILTPWVHVSSLPAAGAVAEIGHGM